MLDLGLQHLDIIIDGDVADHEELDSLIQACGDSKSFTIYHHLILTLFFSADPIRIRSVTSG